MGLVPMVSYPRRLADLAAADPDRPAITDERRTVTRAELEELASDTAEAFSAFGVGQGDIVVLALPNCVEFLAAMKDLQAEGAIGEKPVIIISVEGREQDTARGLEAGATVYIKKPFHSEEILDVIARLDKGAAA